MAFHYPPAESGPAPPVITADSTNAPVEAPSCGDVTVELRKLKFRPRELTICAGDTITFINKDQVVHNVTEGTPEIADYDFKSPKMGTGKSWTVTFDRPGSVTLYCGTHKKKMRDFTVTVL